MVLAKQRPAAVNTPTIKSNESVMKIKSHIFADVKCGLSKIFATDSDVKKKKTSVKDHPTTRQNFG